MKTLTIRTPSLELLINPYTKIRFYDLEISGDEILAIKTPDEISVNFRSVPKYDYVLVIKPLKQRIFVEKDLQPDWQSLEADLLSIRKTLDNDSISID